MTILKQAICAGALSLAALAGVAAHGQAFSEDDKKFLDKSAQGGLVEVKLGELAAQKGSSADVKMFGQKMAHDHSMLNAKMKPFVLAAGLTPPTALNDEHQQLYDKLNGLSGADFDKEYVKAMDEDHHDDLKEFKAEIASTKNMKLKLSVEKGEAVIAQHTRMIDGISKKMGMAPAGM